MTAEESFKKYPYYIYPAIEALDGAEGEERQKLLRRIACGVGPIAALRTLIGIDPEEFRDFYGDLQQPDLSTSETIDLFLVKFVDNPSSDEMPEEVPIAPPAIDYAASLLDDENLDDMPEDDTASLLSSFLGGSSGNTPQESENPAEDNGQEKISRPKKNTENAEPLSEALVKIMIKNGNYRKALEIITEINLKNPKKSVYFADQIRFLEKLTLLQGGSKE